MPAASIGLPNTSPMGTRMCLHWAKVSNFYRSPVIAVAMISPMMWVVATPWPE